MARDLTPLTIFVEELTGHDGEDLGGEDLAEALDRYVTRIHWDHRSMLRAIRRLADGAEDQDETVTALRRILRADGSLIDLEA